MHSLARATAGKAAHRGGEKRRGCVLFPAFCYALLCFFHELMWVSRRLRWPFVMPLLCFCCVFLLTYFVRFLVFLPLSSSFFCSSALAFQPFFPPFVSVCFAFVCLRFSPAISSACETIPFARRNHAFWAAKGNVLQYGGCERCAQGRLQGFARAVLGLPRAGWWGRESVFVGWFVRRGSVAGTAWQGTGGGEK